MPMKNALKWGAIIMRLMLVVGFVLMLALVGALELAVAYLDYASSDAERPTSVQTFDDYLKWQTPVGPYDEINLRGVTYFHVVVLLSGQNLQPVLSTCLTQRAIT
jgi:hypothetical protein